MHNMVKKIRNRKGFTLIELIVVIAILGILAGLAIPRLTGARNNAAASADAGSVRTIQSAISLAEADGVLDLSGAIAPDATGIAAAIVPRFLAEIPDSQTTGTSGWAITIGGAAGAWTVDVVASASPTTGWTN